MLKFEKPEPLSTNVKLMPDVGKVISNISKKIKTRAAKIVEKGEAEDNRQKDIMASDAQHIIDQKHLLTPEEFQSKMDALGSDV